MVLVYAAVMLPNKNVKFVTYMFVALNAMGLAGCETSSPPLRSKPAFGPEEPLELPRQGHAAVLYQSKDAAKRGVLIVGGIDGPVGSLDFAKQYDLTAGNRGMKESLHPAAYSNFGVEELARIDLRATRLGDGKVLITGGSACVSTNSPSANICASGEGSGCDCANQRRLRGSMLLFDPDQRGAEWSKWAWISKPRSRHTVTVLPMGPIDKDSCEALGQSEILYLLGGRGNTLQETAELFTYAPTCLEKIKTVPGVENVPNVNTVPGVDLSISDVQVDNDCHLKNWGGHTATLLPETKPTFESATILVVGRIQNNASCEAFLVHPKDKSWQEPLVFPSGTTIPCDGHSAEIIGPADNQKIAIIGGEIDLDPATGKGTPLDQILLFDPNELRTPSGKMIVPQVLHMTAPHSHAATGLMNSGAVIVTGGYSTKDGGVQSVVEKCDGISGTCARLADMPYPRVFHTMTKLQLPNDKSLAEHFLVVGGRGDTVAVEAGVDTSLSSFVTLYLNEACETDSDCSPDSQCASLGTDKNLCVLREKK